MEGLNPQYAVFGALLGLMIGTALMFRPRMAMLGLAMLIFLSSIGVARDYRQMVWVQWLTPLQEQRAIVIVGLASTLIPFVLFFLPKRGVAGGIGLAFGMLAMSVCFGSFRIVHAGFQDAILSVGLASLLFGATITIFNRSTDTWEDLVLTPRMIVFPAILFLAASVVQIAVNPSHVVIGNANRFIGVGTNPQFVAVLLSFQITACVWLILNDTKTLRGLWIVLVVLMGAAIVGTGSRTGLMMTISGISILMMRRFGRVILAIPIVLLAGYLALTVAESLGLGFSLERFTSSENTRSVAWEILINQFTANPAFGVGVGGTEMSENSFLYAAASFGVTGPFLLIVFSLFCILHCVRLWRSTLPFQSLHSISDLCVAIIVMYLLGSIFEGYMIARISPVPLIVCLALLCSGRLMAMIRASDGEVADVDEDVEGEDDEELVRT
ncbi:MAG: hypothetical protein O2800_01610 [Planctomycetota bacterium]|nr:hypothetical protein [Planctomycetota bacterium]